MVVVTLSVCVTNPVVDVTIVDVEAVLTIMGSWVMKTLPSQVCVRPPALKVT